MQQLGLLYCLLACCLAQVCVIDASETCSRDRSRLARSIIKKYIEPYAYWNSYELPEACPLHPKQDIFSSLEGAKHHASASKWNCTVCGSHHDSEPGLDQHLHEEHSNLIQEEGGQCLADLCDVLHCDYIAEEIMAERSPGVDRYARHSPCIPSKELQIKQKCKEVAELCFPVEAGPKAPLMWGFFHGHICLAHNCNEEARRDLLMTVIDSRPHFQWGFSIFAGFVTAVLLGFYLIFWLYMRIFVGTMAEDEFTSMKPNRKGFTWPWNRKPQSKEL